MKTDWNYVKQQFIEYVKLGILILFMTLGFWFVYTLIWFVVGLPQNNWALWATFALSCASEYGYLKWLGI